jgi:hypothetical protein
MNEREIQKLILRKMEDFKPALPEVSIRFFERNNYLVWAKTTPFVQEEIKLGWYQNFEDEFKDPVLVMLEKKLIGTCPRLFVEILTNEPPEIQRFFIEGAFLSRLFLFLVPGRDWEREEQIRNVMQKHFPLLLAALESIRGVPLLKKDDKQLKKNR